MSTKTLIGAAVVVLALILTGAGFAIFNHVRQDRLENGEGVGANEPVNPLSSGGNSGEVSPMGNLPRNPQGNPASPQNPLPNPTAPANPLAGNSGSGQPQPAGNPLGQ
jgi:hypothetical protein